MLALCSAEFSLRAAKFIAALENQGYDPYIRESWRSEAAQEEAVRRGRSEVSHGRHNEVGAEGEPASSALDLKAISRFHWRERAFEAAVACTAQKYDLETGIAWGLATEQRAAVAKVIFNLQIS